MTESRDEWIKKRAYSLWEQEGYPTGRDQQHWEQAMKERAVMETTAPHGLAVKVKTKAPKAATKKVAATPKVELSKTATKSKSATKSNGSIAPAIAAKRAGKKDAIAKL